MNDSDALLRRVLGERRVRKTVVDVYDADFDRVMERGEGERPWQSFELTQREDVIEWIRDPSTIRSIQPNLADLRERLGPLPRPVSVLDVGCYGGYLYDWLRDRCFGSLADFSYTGVDIDPDVVAAARRVHAGAPNATFDTGDVYALTEVFGERAFDVVFCSRVLIHIPYHERALRELYRTSRALCFVVLETSAAPMMQRIHRENLDTGEALDYFFRKYSLDELSSAAATLGADFRVQQGPGIYASFILRPGNA